MTSSFILDEIMNNLSLELNNIITSAIKKYNQRIAEKYNLNVTELNSLWETDEKVQVKVTTEVVTVTKKSEVESEPSSSKVNCPYVFTKGVKAGQTCGCRAKGDRTYCSRHKKYEGQTPKVKKVLPPTRKSIVSGNKKKTPKRKKRLDIILHKGPSNYLYHRITGLIFNKDKVAVGTWLRAIDNPNGKDEVHPLTAKDIEIAKKNMFPYKETTLSSGDDKSTPVKHVTRVLEPDEAKKLKKSLSSAITETNIKADDITDILSELQTSGELVEEEVADESDYSEEFLEEES